MVKRKSCLGSNEEFRVRILVELVDKQYGVRSVAAAARLAVNQMVRVRLPSDTLTFRGIVQRQDSGLQNQE